MKGWNVQIEEDKISIDLFEAIRVKEGIPAWEDITMWRPDDRNSWLAYGVHYKYVCTVNPDRDPGIHAKVMFDSTDRKCITSKVRILSTEELHVVFAKLGDEFAI
jgi:hypothetical protein